jgi:hypothetical protein
MLDATGKAVLSTTFSATGSYSITATYAGVTGVAGSVSAPFMLTVITPAVNASFSPGTLTVNSGGSGTLTLTLTPVGGYTGSVTFSCGTLPAHVTCTFAPQTLSRPQAPRRPCCSGRGGRGIDRSSRRSASGLVCWDCGCRPSGAENSGCPRCWRFAWPSQGWACSAVAGQLHRMRRRARTTSPSPYRCRG